MPFQSDFRRSGRYPRKGFNRMSHAEQMLDAVLRRSGELVVTTDSFDSVPPSLDSVQRRQQLLARQRYLERKYKFERFLGCLLLIPAAPVILLFGLLVKLTSPGPVFYRQERLGYSGVPYYIIKIRTMRIDAEADGVARWCVKNDSRITPLGWWLRKLHIDELPQLINVVRGEMVLVGPRPERPMICERLAGVIDGYYDRLRVKPGITGLAQINLPPDESDDDVRRKQTLDLQYIDEASAWLDFRMIFATALRMVGIKGDRVTKALGLCRLSLVEDAVIVKLADCAADDHAGDDDECGEGSSGFRRATVPRQPR